MVYRMVSSSMTVDWPLKVISASRNLLKATPIISRNTYRYRLIILLGMPTKLIMMIVRYFLYCGIVATEHKSEIRCDLSVSVITNE